MGLYDILKKICTNPGTGNMPLTRPVQVDLLPLFEENKREEKEEMRFETARPTSCVILKLEEVAKAVKFGVRLQGLENGGRGNWAD
ncbi:hypothetical protein RJ640_018284 [Escallonia rubra]|uniref:NAF domain-containing protein n=1 Tax=Escallonia rubra TaxID=112253 RepID=A0AA88U4D1_9ASTE|nr:hypothetical protein RJ640_018284 [Escallonia rubra]